MKGGVDMSIRILQIVVQMNRGGIENMLMNYYRHMDREQVQFDFMVHGQEHNDFDEEIKALGGCIYRMPRLNPFNPLYYYKIYRFFKNHPEHRVIHCHMDCMSAVPLAVARIAGVPYRIVHSHNSNEIRNIKFLIKMFCRFLIPFGASTRMAASKLAGRWLFGKRKFKVLPNAIDVRDFRKNDEIREEVRHELGIDKDAMVIGHVGRFMPQKNHQFLAEIFSKVLVECPNATLLLVGTGKYQDEFRKKAVALDIIDHIIFAGNRSDVNRVIQAMDCFVLPSLFEGFPVVLVEAQAAGLPCVVSSSITKESSLLPDRVCKMSLNDDSSKWAETIIASAKMGRIDTMQDMVNAGYDICTVAEKLQRYYMHYDGLYHTKE